MIFDPDIRDSNANEPSSFDKEIRTPSRRFYVDPKGAVFCHALPKLLLQRLHGLGAARDQHEIRLSLRDEFANWTPNLLDARVTSAHLLYGFSIYYLQGILGETRASP
jgi:hypothetical protein